MGINITKNSIFVRKILDQIEVGHIQKIGYYCVYHQGRQIRTRYYNILWNDVPYMAPHSTAIHFIKTNEWSIVQSEKELLEYLLRN